MRYFYDDDDEELKRRQADEAEQESEEDAEDRVAGMDDATEAGNGRMSMDDDEDPEDKDEKNNSRNRHDKKDDKEDGEEDGEKTDDDVAKEGQDATEEAGKDLEDAAGEPETPSTNTADMSTVKTPKQPDGVTPDEDPTAAQSSPGRETPSNETSLPTDSSSPTGKDPTEGLGKSPTESGSSAGDMPGSTPLGEGELGANPAQPPQPPMAGGETAATEGGIAAEEGVAATEGGAAAVEGGTAAAEGGAATAGGGVAATEGGAAAAGGAAAGGVALFWVAIIILIIIVLIGVAGFFLTMPQFLWNKLKEMALSLWTGFYGYFVGMDEATVNEDDIKAVAQYLHDMGYDLVGMGFAEDVSINERDPKTGKLKDEDQAEDQILDLTSPYLNAYLVAENRTYMINNFTFNISDAVSSIFLTGNFFDEGVSTWGTGLINLDQSIVDAFGMPLYAVRIGEFNVGEWIKGVKVDRASNTLRIRRLNFDWFDTHNDYTYYSLAGWSGRYGKPFELSLTLHVATMAPDLVRQFCMDPALDAKVNIKLRKSDINGQVLVDGKTIDQLESAGTYDEDTIKELRKFESKYISEIKTKVPYISSVTKHWFRNVYFEGTDSIDESYHKVGAVTIGVDEDNDDIEDYKQERGEKEQKTTQLSSSDNVYKFGESSSTGEFTYSGDEAPDVGGAKITINGTYTNGVVQYKDAVRGVTNLRTKELFKDKYYIYDGTVEKAEQIQEARRRNDDSMKEEVKMTKESLSAFSILESSETLDAQYIYRDLKELVIELGYFEKEDFDKIETQALLWPLPDFKRKGWPDRKYEKQILDYGTLMLCRETVDKIKEYEKQQEEATTNAMTPTSGNSYVQNTTSTGGGQPTSGNPGGSKVKSQFSDETAAIVEQHLYDFNRFDFESKMSGYGGFENYCKNQLGGIFAKWTGVDNIADVQTVEEFQEIAEYVWGLMVIYGFDYSNGDPGHYGTWRHADKLSPDDGFHQDQNPDLECLPDRNIDKICNGSQGLNNVVVNCNWGTDYLMFKCGIFSKEDPSKPTSSCDYTSLVNDYGGQIITNKEDLKPGDIIECFESKLTDLSNPSSWGAHSWFHVCTVGEVDEVADTITIYDSGHYFTESGNYKHVIRRSGDYFPYTGWAAIRVTNLADEGLIGFPPNKDVIAMAKGEVIKIYHDGENEFTQSYMSTLIYGEDMTKDAEPWDFEASEQTDEGLRIKITDGPIKNYELVIYGFDLDDSIYEGMEVEADTVIGKTIKSNMCFVLIDKDKGVVENVEDYVRKPEDMERLRSKNDFDVSDEANFIRNPATFIMMFKGYDNIIANARAFIDMQDKYHVNAAFAACVTIVESSGGTDWDAIDPSTHNWFSIKGDYKGQSKGGWRSYPSYAAAIDDFGDLIANTGDYYSKGKHTVNEIGPTYCNEGWSEKVNSLMKTAYENYK